MIQNALPLNQPPSGGCVLKLDAVRVNQHIKGSAAFGRLRVETLNSLSLLPEIDQPPSGGCVLKPRRRRGFQGNTYSAAFGRLRVETFNSRFRYHKASAAFGRLRVETLVFFLIKK